MADPGYGTRFWPVWRAAWRDHRAGDRRRARARLGFLSPPEGRGRLIWIKAGASREALQLGVELLGAVRDRRRDVRIVLTFERDDPDLLRALLRSWPRVGLGYGPSDRPRVVRRVLARFRPAGVLLAESAPPETLLQRLSAPVAAIGTGPARTRVTAAWPLSATEYRVWQGSGAVQDLLPAADPQARFAEARADVVLRTLAGGGTRRLWWWHGDSAGWDAWWAHWRAAPLADDILLVSLEDGGAPATATLAASSWDRRPLPGGTVVHLDDRRWWAAAASAADGIHLAGASRGALWQALAAGSAVSMGVSSPIADLPVSALVQPERVLAHWQTLRGDTQRRRGLGDAARRRFWTERRQVDRNLAALMDRVWVW
nr:glycosyltransferase N-terminal domain-containing protein [Thioalkalivibrio nitratireducens]